MTESLTLALRVGFSFMVVIGLMWVMARVFRGKLGVRSAGSLEVVARQQVGRGASVAIVRIADRAIVVGVTEHAVTMLGDPISDHSSLDPSEPATADTAQTESGEVRDVRDVFAARRSLTGTTSAPAPSSIPTGKLSGSVLSPATWRQAMQVLRERTVRRG